MFEIYMDFTAISVIILGITVPLTIILLLTQYYVHKKTLDSTYYNTNHFSENELVVFTSGFIFYIVKTLIYVRAIALPKTMRIRFKKDILTFKDHPSVYLLACFTLLLIIVGGIIIANLIIALTLWEYSK